MPNKSLSLITQKPLNIARAEAIIERLDVSELTRKDYRYRLPLFFSFLERNPINYDSFLQYKRHLDKMNFSVSSKNKYLIVARIFFRELARLGLLPVDLTLNIKSFPTIKRHKKDGMNESEIKRLVSSIRRLDNTALNVRKKALFCLLCLQGMRTIEIVRLDFDHIDLVNNIAHVQGKGKIDREIVHLHPQTIKTIKEYIRVCKIKDGALFKSLGNRKSERLSTMTIKREVKDMLQPLGISKSPHAFRHFFVTHLLEKFPVRDVRKFSRHANLEMLITYDDELDMKRKSTQVFQAFNNLAVLTS